MSKFANLYWSADYRSGIDSLSTQLLRSISQLHELRKLVFNFMKHYHTAGESLTGLAQVTLSSGRVFETSKRRQRHDQVKADVNMSHIFNQYKERCLAERGHYQALTSNIDRLVLEKVTDFIKQHETQILKGLDVLGELFQDYESCYQTIEKIMDDIDSSRRLLEFSAVDAGDTSTDTSNVSLNGEPLEIPELSTDHYGTSILSPQLQIPISSREVFSFPLSIGNVITFSNISHFRDFFSRLVDAISVTRRTIPLPGYKNEIFSSEQLCEYLLKVKSVGFNPSRLNLERFGQGLVDLKIIIGTGFFAKKFASEGKWYEWSDFFLEVLSERCTQASRDSDLSAPKLSSLNLEGTHQYVNEIAEVTSKKFNGMFKSMKSSFLKSKNPEEAIKALEKSYNDTYEELQKTRHLLDVEILHQSNYLETFERLKIEVIYRSLTKLLEIIYGHSLELVEQMHDFTQQFVSKFNKAEHYEKDFENMISEFCCGIYFPSNIAPNNITHKNFALNTNFQNINLEFDLYMDIPLQVNVSNALESLLTHKSIPEFLFEMIRLIEQEPADSSELKKLWFAPLNQQSYWLIKSELLSVIRTYTPSPDINIHSLHDVQRSVIHMIIRNLKTKDNMVLVNFMKNWCLEIGDSIIPSTVFESLIGNYAQKNAKGNISETIRILSTIPRANLSSLVYMMEHISKVNEISALQRFGEADDVVMPQQETDSGEKIEKAALSLNCMKSIGSVPFIHLIMRPSIAKSSSGFIPPIQEYNKLLMDLLNPEVRYRLLQGLLISERRHIERQEQQKKNLGIIKKAPGFVLEPAQESVKEEQKITESTPKQPSKSGGKGLSLQGENFELRPFRTGNTPRPSPIGSPVHRKESSVDVMPRDSSSNFLSPIGITLHGSP